MTLLQLHYFIDLSTEQSFTQVAKNYYVAQSVVSYQIHSLEEELGTTLFERSTRTVRLTSAGRSFYADVAPLVSKLELACQNVKRKTIRVPFAIGYSRVCYGSRFHQLLEKIMVMHPETEFILQKIEPEDGLLPQLQACRLDAALFFNPYGALPKNISSYDFGIARQMAVMHKSNALSTRASISKSDLNASDILACEGMRKMEQIFRPENRSEEYDNKGILLKDMESVFAMIQSRRGVACLPVIDDFNIPDLAYVPLNDEQFIHNGPHLTFAWSPMADNMILKDMQKLVLELLPIAGNTVQKHTN